MHPLHTPAAWDLRRAGHDVILLACEWVTESPVTSCGRKIVLPRLATMSVVFFIAAALIAFPNFPAWMHFGSSKNHFPSLS
jgi:hypothetical protein